MTHTGPIACSFNSSRVVQSHDCLYRLPSLCFFVGMYILDFHILLGMQISYFSTILFHDDDISRGSSVDALVRLFDQNICH